MICIYCREPGRDMADSHVISKFFRNRLTGIVDQKGQKRYSFQWIDRPDLPKQDLPKPNLLCIEHDNKFGDVIEGLASSLIIPSKSYFLEKNVAPPNWRMAELDLSIGESSPISVAYYASPNDVEDDTVNKFAILTAWRALHALRLDNVIAVTAFLSSSEGMRVNDETIAFLDVTKKDADLLYPYGAQFYLMGPCFARDITGSDEDMPFAYQYLERDGQRCIVVLMGFWVIIWPLLHQDDPKLDFLQVRQMVFIDWFLKLSDDYRAQSKQR